MSAENFIYNETPSGSVDGVNTVFTTVNSINKLEDFYVGWVPYRSIFSIGTNTITLNDAPPTWAVVSVDYFKV